MVASLQVIRSKARAASRSRIGDQASAFLCTESREILCSFLGSALRVRAPQSRNSSRSSPACLRPDLQLLAAGAAGVVDLARNAGWGAAAVALFCNLQLRSNPSSCWLDLRAGTAGSDDGFPLSRV